MGAKGLARAKVAEDGSWTQSPLAKTVTPGCATAINAATGAKDGRSRSASSSARSAWCTR